MVKLNEEIRIIIAMSLFSIVIFLKKSLIKSLNIAITNLITSDSEKGLKSLYIYNNTRNNDGKILIII